MAMQFPSVSWFDKIMRQSMGAISHSIVAPASIAAGLFWPDIDLLLIRFIGHRSILTHSALLPVSFLLFTYLLKSGVSRLAARRLLSWFCVGVGAHLFADLFVQKWVGFALIKLPFGYGSLRGMSLIFILINLLVCLIISEWIMRDDRGWRRISHSFYSFFCVVIYFQIHEKKFWIGLIGASAWIIILKMTQRASRRLNSHWWKRSAPRH